MTEHTYIDVHIIQSVPPSCINRDDTGSPKTARFGGVTRARVSSQAWKRATRTVFEEHLSKDDLGVRTKRVVQLTVNALSGANLEDDDADRLAAAVVSAAGLKLAKARGSERQDTEFLVLVSNQQAEALGALAQEALNGAGGDVAAAIAELSSAERKKQAKRVLQQGNSVDLALFGRMVANDTDLNVDAACQVAHAISVHAVDNEFDYFTAVDDLKSAGVGSDEPGDVGAGMIGTVEFNSATLYRYATINAVALAENLGDHETTKRAISAFLTGFARSMPTGKQNTFANNTLPEAIVVSLRSDQPVSYVGAFEAPIQTSGGYAASAAAALAAWANDIEQAYGTACVQSWVTGVGLAGEQISSLGERVSFGQLPDEVAAAAVKRLSESE